MHLLERLSICNSFEILGPPVLLLQTDEHHLHELNSSGTAWAAFGTQSPIFPDKEGTGLRTGTAPVSAPCLNKESEQGEERKLLPESEPLWVGRRLSEPTITSG